MSEVACFGEVLWDLLEEERGTYVRELGGAAANVAVTLARLGVRAEVVAGIGQDAFGDEMVAALSAENVGVRRVVKLPLRTGIVFITKDKRFVPYRERSAELAVDSDHVTPTKARWLATGATCGSLPNLARATERLLEGGAHLAIDVNARPYLFPDARALRRAMKPLLARAALVKMSDEDAARLGLAWARRNVPGDAVLLVTRGGAPATALGPFGAVEVRAQRARCVDPIGAGDAFFAGALAAVITRRLAPGARSWSDAGAWRDVVGIGHMCGAAAVARLGAIPRRAALAPARRALAARS